MHGQKARDYFLKVVPSLFIIVVVKIDCHFFGKVFDVNISLIVLDGLDLNDDTSNHIFNLD